MARGTDFGGIHSSRDLNLIQQSVDEQPAEPKLNLVEIPGADGTKDLSELPAGRVLYNDRTVTWTFALYPGDNWATKHRQVSNLLNGRRCHITLDTNPGYYYIGRLTVKKYNLDMTLRQITVEATCSPYMRKQNITTVEVNFNRVPAGEFIPILLENERMPTVPTIEVTVPATIKWGNAEAEIGEGSFTSLDIELQAGANTLYAKSATGEGKISIHYQEGSL